MNRIKSFFKKIGVAGTVSIFILIVIIAIQSVAILDMYFRKIPDNTDALIEYIEKFNKSENERLKLKKEDALNKSSESVKDYNENKIKSKKTIDEKINQNSNIDSIINNSNDSTRNYIRAKYQQNRKRFGTAQE